MSDLREPERFRPLDYLRAVRASDLSGHEKSILVWILSYADESGQGFPSTAKLAEVSGFSRATVCRALDRLRARGWLVVRRKSRTMSNTYRLLVPKSQGETSPGETSQAATTQPATSPCANTPPGTCDVAEGDGRSLRETLAKSQPEARSAHRSAHRPAHESGESAALAGDLALQPMQAARKSAVQLTEPSSKPRPSPSRTHVPEPQHEVTWARSHAIPPEHPEFPKFADHFRSKGEAKVDWPATWRQWLRRVPDFAPKRAFGGPAQTHLTPEDEAELARRKREAHEEFRRQELARLEARKRAGRCEP